MEFKIKLLNPNAQIPKYQTQGAACFDLASPFAFKMWEEDTYIVHFGIAVEMPSGYKMLLYPRGSLFTQHQIILTNHVGVVDCDYRGEIKAVLYRLPTTNGDPVTQVGAGERILQAEVVPVWQAKILVVDTLSATKRGSGSYGHTGRF